MVYVPVGARNHGVTQCNALSSLRDFGKFSNDHFFDQNLMFGKQNMTPPYKLLRNWYFSERYVEES